MSVSGERDEAGCTPTRPAACRQRDDGFKTRLAWVALAVLIGALSVSATITAFSRQSPSSEYLTQARRCVELNDCPSRGGRAGGLPLFHGTAWIRLLAYSLRTGADLTRVQSIVLGSCLLSIAITFLFMQRYLGLRAATLALGLYFPLVLVGTDITFLTYTNLLPFIFAVYYAGVCLLVEFRRTVFAVLAAVALAAAVSVELGSIVMVPFHFLLVGLIARRWVLAVAAAGLAFAIPYCWDSPDAALAMLRQLPTIRFAVCLAISGALAALAAQFSPRRTVLASMALKDRMRTMMTAAMIYASATLVLGCLFLLDGWPQPRYFLPAVFPFLYLAAERMRNLGMRTMIVLIALESLCLLLLPFAPHALKFLQMPFAAVPTLYVLAVTLRRIRRRRHPSLTTPAVWPCAVTCLMAIAVAAGDLLLLAKRGPAQAFTMAEAEPLVAKLYAAGYTYTELLGSLQGPAADDLMDLLMERDPQVFTEPPQKLSEATFSLLVLKVPRGAVDRTHGLIAEVRIDESRSAIVVRGDRSYLDWIRMRRCSWTTQGGKASYRCVEPRTDRPVPHNWPYVEFAESAQSAQNGASGWAVDHSIRFEVPVDTPGHGVPHIVRVANEWPTTWRIARVSGVEFEGQLPGAEIRLPDRQAAHGVVELEFAALAPGDPPWAWIPHVTEVAEQNEHLLEPFRNAG